MRSLKYLSVAMLFAVSSCTYNQYTMTGGGNDDLYGGRYDEAVAVAGNRAARPSDYNTNPDYQAGNESAQATDQYYDENYVTARNIQRNVSNQVGYNAGFTDGYFAGRNNGFYNNFYGGMYPSWGYPGFNVGFRMGMGSMISLGYSPFGWNRWNRWGSFYDPYWDAMAWGDPFMYGGSYYGGFGYPYGGMGYYGSMYGYNPYSWSNYYPLVVNNYYGESGTRTRNYGPRTSGSAVSRTAALPSSRRDPGTTPTARSGARTSTGRGNGIASSDDGYYTRPRSAVSSSRVSSGNSNSRVSGARGASNTDGNYYYANPNSNRSSYSGSSNARTRSNSVYRASESGRSSSGYYSAPSSRSSSSYSAPSRSYSSPSSSPSRSYSAPSSTPTRSYSAPSSAPSRSYSAPSSGGGGVRSSSGGGGRGPR